MKLLVLGIVLGFLAAVLVILGFGVASINSGSSGRAVVYQVLSYSVFVAEIEEGKIEDVVFQGAAIIGRFKDGRRFTTRAPHTQVIPALTERLLAGKVTVTARPGEDDSSDLPAAVSTLISWLPFLVNYGLFFGGLWLFLARPMMALTRQLQAFIQVMPTSAPGGRPA